MGRTRKALGSVRKRLKGVGNPALDASIERIGPAGALEFSYGDIAEVPLLVRNTGSEVLSSHRQVNPDLVSYHWETSEGEAIDREGLRTPLPEPVPPGGSATLRLKVSVTTPLENPVLSVDMVREGTRWFSDGGSATLRIPCRVEAAPEEQQAADLPAPAHGGGAAASVDELWGERAGIRKTQRILGWLDHPVVLQECILPKLGTPGTNWVSILAEKHGVPRGGHWLSLGCGDGFLEMWLVEQGIAASVEGVDVSPGAVEVANRTAAESGLDGVRFRSMDLNSEPLPDGAYDVILGSMSIHHIENLEEAFDSIFRALRPGGFFLANEFVGPSRMQFTHRQVELAERLIALLPGELRRNLEASASSGTTVFKDRYRVRPVEEWIEVDPSEAVRSSEITGVFTRIFNSNRVYPYGGALLHLALEHIAGNFDPDDQKDRALLRVMDLMETELTAAGTLDNDFAMLVGLKPGGLET